MDGKKVVLGLSGGVDSAVAANKLKEQGFEVYGVYLDITDACIIFNTPYHYSFAPL